MSKKFNKLIAFLGSTALACFIVAGIIFCLPLLSKTAIASSSSGFTRITATELTFNGENRSDDDGSAGTNAVGDRGLQVYTSTSSSIGTGSTLTIPEGVSGDVSIKMETQVNKVDRWATSFAEFRLVHNNKVIFPTDGGWFDLYEHISNTEDGTDELKGTKFMSSLSAFNMKAGDKLHFIFRDKNGINNWASYYCTFGMTIGGVWFDATSANHINPANDTATSSYFGGTSYNYSDFWSYNQYTWQDFEPANIDIDGYESKIIKSNATRSRMYPRKLQGTEYFVFNVKNSSESAQKLWMNYYEGPDEGTYGQTWTTAEYEYYYVYNEGITTKEQMPAAFQYNNSKMNIPAGFDGTIYLPVESLKENGWGRNQTRNNLFNDRDTLYLESAFVDLDASDWDSITVSSFGVIGADLSDVSNTANTAINLIKKIGTVITLGSENLIANARACYDALSAEEQAKVTNYEDLTNAETTFASLVYDTANVATNGKDFTGTEGVSLSKIYATSPSTFSAYVKIDKDYDGVNSVGTIVGNKENTLISQSVEIKTGTFAVSVTAKGEPKFEWKVSTSQNTEWVVKNVDLRNGKWTNVAFTRDTANGVLSCYVDGVLVDSLTISAEKIADMSFYKPVIVGADYTTDKIMAIGYKPDFKGQLANVRVYSDVLTADEIVTGLSSIVADNGLMTAIDFASGENGNYYDYATNLCATDAYAWAGDTSSLMLGDYTMAVLGDTQMHLSSTTDGSGKNLYADGYDYTTNVFYKNIQWLIANKDTINLQFLMHMGDITDNLNNNYTDSATGKNKGETEMDYAMQWMDLLTEAKIPWSLNRGNHDSKAYFDTKYNYTDYGATYGAKFSGVEFGYYDYDGVANSGDEDMRNTYYKFTVEGLKYMVVSLDCIPSLAEMNWASEIISANPDHLVIVTTHAYMNAKGTGYVTDVMNMTSEYTTCESIWTNLVSKHQNIFLSLSGHSSGTDVGRSYAVGDNGNIVHQIMVDESRLEYSGNYDIAPFGLLGFENGGKTIHFNFYSATDDQLFRDWNQFTIELDDSYGISYGTGLKNGFVEKSELSIDVLPTSNPYVLNANSNGGTDGISGGSTFESGGWTTRTTRQFSIGMVIENDGYFYFDEEAFINNRNSCKAWVTIFVTDKDGVTRRAWPVNSKYYEFAVSADNYYLADYIGGIEVNAGDLVTYSANYRGNCYARQKIWGNVYDKPLTDSSATLLREYTLKSGYSGAASTDCLAIINGTKTDYVIGSCQANFDLDFVDEKGNMIFENVGYSPVLPKYERSGQILLGYKQGSNFYPAGKDIKLADDGTGITYTMVFASLSMYNGAATRVGDYGMRFSTYLDMTAEEITALGITANYGTLIAPDYEITVDGVKDYSILTVDYVGKMINLKSTVQVQANGYTIINASAVNLSDSQLELKLVARGYMTVTYADGTEITFYAGVTDNARSIMEIATTALADISKIKTDEYKYAVDGGYSCYDAGAREYFETVIAG